MIWRLFGSSLPRPVFLDPDDLPVEFFFLSTIRGFPVERYYLALGEILEDRFVAYHGFLFSSGNDTGGLLLVVLQNSRAWRPEGVRIPSPASYYRTAYLPYDAMRAQFAVDVVVGHGSFHLVKFKRSVELLFTFGRDIPR